MPHTVAVKPEMIAWAVYRSQLPLDDLEAEFPKLDDWQSGDSVPTMRELERLAQKTMTPLGYFFLAEPPDKSLSIPDFRTRGDRPLARPSPNLKGETSRNTRPGWSRGSGMNINARRGIMV